MRAQSKTSLSTNSMIKKVKSNEQLKNSNENKNNRLSNLLRDQRQKNQSHQKNINRSEIVGLKSTPNLFKTNNYIKIDPESSKKYESMLMEYKQHQPLSSHKFSRRQSHFLKNQPKVIESKSPKFMRKSLRHSFISADGMNQNINSQQNLQNLKQEFEKISLLLNEKQKKINELEKQLRQIKLPTNIQKKVMKIKELQKKLEEKDKEIQSLKEKNQPLKTKRSQQFEAQLATLAKFQDLQQKLYLKDTEIFDLRKQLEQMKIKFHCSELMHNDELKRANLKWQTKYKNLFEEYKNLQKSMNTKHSNNYASLNSEEKHQGRVGETILDFSLSTEKSFSYL